MIFAGYPALTGFEPMTSAIPLQYSNDPTESWFLFLEGPGKFLHPESRNEISNLMITELFPYKTFQAHITASKSKNQLTLSGFSGPKSFRGFRETGPWLLG